MDYLALAFDSIAIRNKIIRKSIGLFTKLYYRDSVDPSRGFLHRYLNAEKVKNKTTQSSSQLTLHTGTFDLPFLKSPANQKHYLYCDFTWNLAIGSSFDNTTKKLKQLEELEQRSYLQMEHIFPISEYVKENLITHYGIHPEKITVVGTGLGVIKPFYGPKDYSNHKILFAAKGRFEDKGGPLVLEAFKLAYKTNPALELIIIGQNEYTEKINLPNVTTYGFLTVEELQNIFNICSLFFMPALHEPWGLVYLEALACKMPIVGLNRNSFPEISGNGEYGFILNDSDPIKLSEILLRAFANPQKLAEIGENGQKYCLDKFSWNNTVSKIIQTIKEINK